MKIYIEKDNTHISQDSTCTARELLESLKINPSTVIVVKNGTVVLDDEVLERENDIQILSVVSGG
ncbi:MAG: MoaD/ThiS family protein [Candidatus Woesearchaeota archaeon]